MNRYESAYRDYTQRDIGARAGTPQRPERKGRGPGRALRNDSSHSNSSGEESSHGRRLVHVGGGGGGLNRGYTTDEDSSFNHPSPHPISSRELSDRSGERSNPDYTITNALQTEAEADYRR